MKVKSTDSLIYASVEQKNKEIYDTFLKNKQKMEQNKTKKMNQKKQKQVSGELEELKRRYEMVRSIFEPAEEDLVVYEDKSVSDDSVREEPQRNYKMHLVEWHETLKFEKMIATLDTRKDLLRHNDYLGNTRHDLLQELKYTKQMNDTHERASEYTGKKKPCHFFPARL